MCLDATVNLNFIICGAKSLTDSGMTHDHQFCRSDPTTTITPIRPNIGTPPPTLNKLR